MTNKKIYITTISGGKDSVAMTDLLLKNNYPVDYIVFNDTSMEFKEMYKYINKLNQYFKEKYNKEIITIKPKYNFKDYIHKKRTRGENKDKAIGFLSPEVRFCEIRRDNKEATFKKWLKFKGIKNNYFVYIGFTKEEFKRANNLKINNPNFIFPLIDYFSMSEKDCLEYLDKNNLKNPLYQYFNRTGCKFCHYQSVESWFNIWKYFPNDWQELKDLEKEILLYNDEEICNKYLFSGFKTTKEMEEEFIKIDKQKKLF